jgi:4-amino-4-deoxy-L-arabinose transferase-like glycosyltransferase
MTPPTETEAESGSRPPGGWDPVLGWILLGALVVRGLALFLISPTPLAGDELDYFWRGAERMQGIEPADLGFRPPLMEFLYGGLFRITGEGIPAARIANVLIGVLLLIPLYQLGQRLGGRGTARLGTALAAAYPNFIAFSHYLWSETVYLFVVLCGICLVLSHVERPSLVKLAGAGFAFALGALARVVGVAFPVVAAGWLLWRARASLRTQPLTAIAGPACLLGAMVLTIAPWTAHLNREGEPFAPLTRTTYFYLYVGNGEPVHGAPPVNYYESLGDTRIEREAGARELVIPQILARMPTWPFEKLASELPNFFSPTSFAVRRLLMPEGRTWWVDRAWRYEFRFEALNADAARMAGVVAIVGSYLVLVLLGSLGLGLMPDSPPRQLMLLFVVSQIGPAVAIFAVSRFRIASMAVLILAAAWLIRAGPGAWRQATPLSRGLAAGATAAIAWMIVLRWSQISSHVWG